MFLAVKCLKKALIFAILLAIAVPMVRAQGSDDLDNYKWRFEGNWWFSHPNGSFGLRNSNNYFDINRDFGFGNYSTFTGSADWHFGHKHHLLVNITPNRNSRTTVINRDIMFQGATFPANAQVSASINSLNVAPGYQYDILRRDHGFLGLEADVNLLRTTGKLSAAASVGGLGGAISRSASLLAPVPSVGPVFRWYPLNDSDRLALDGSIRGMPFFGYGNFLTGRLNMSVRLTHHLRFRAGYEMGSRLSVHGTSDQIAIKVAHYGPTAGLEYSFGESPAKKVPNPNPNPSDWHVNWIPIYLWFTGLSGNVGAGGYVVPVSVSFSDVVKQLNIGLMTSLDVRRKRVGLFTDLVFISLTSDQRSTPFGAFSGFTANAKQLIIDPEAYVRLLDSDRGYIDAVAGARFWRLDNSLDLFPVNTSQSPVTVGQTQDWVDPVLGARFRLNLGKGFFANVKGDAGGFGVGSQQTYQIYSGLGKEFKKKYSALVGYRYLYVDYTNGGFVYDVHMSGALVGLNIRFK
jgi:hypothetical protein